MGLSVSERVHIMPVGYERQRIVKPAVKYRADKVVLIGHKGDAEGSDGADFWNNVRNDLHDNDIEFDDSRKCDIFDLYSSLGTIAEAINAHSDDDVFVNVATGSKVTAIGGMIASMVLDSTPYYVRARDYENHPTDVTGYLELPTYPIDAPETEQVDVMKFIQLCTEHEGPPTKGEVIHFSEKAGLSFIRRNVAGKGKYRLLDRQIVEPLWDRGYIDESEQGRSKLLHLTPKGEAALEAFQWLVDEDIDWEEIRENGVEGDG